MVILLDYLLRIFDFTTKLMGFLHAEIFVWSESQLVLGRSFAFLEKAKTDIKEVVLARTSIPINAADPTGKGGNVNKGDTAQQLLTTHRELMVELVPHRFQDHFRVLLCRLWVSVKVYTSTSKVDTGLQKFFS